ncbi:MAG: hypothetical protein ABSD67_03755 [Terracidiphilus sp.]
MRTWKVILATTAITLAVGGAYLFIVFKHRANPGVIGQNDATGSF